jgi:two-component system nitrate/nitrite response regulator NarL
MAHLAAVVDSSSIYRSGLAQALKKHGIDTVVEMDEAQFRTEIQADVFIIGASSPGGRKLIREVRTHHPETPIVAIVPSSDPGPRLHAAVLTDGAMTALSREAPRAVIAAAIRVALEGWAVLVLPSEDIGGFSMRFLQVLRDVPQPITEEEAMLLQRIFQGTTRRALAEEFHVGLRTLDRHIQDVYQKLNASNHTDAILRALLWGYLTRSISPRATSN